MKKIAIIGAETMARNYAENARMMGVESHAFAYEKGAIARDVVDVFHPISIFEIDKIVNECRNLGVNGVVATTELTVAVAAKVANALGLNGIDPEVASMLTDKYHNREVTKFVEGLSHPWYAKFNSVETLLAAELPFPVIVKPVSEGGKRGISVVRNRDELRSALEYAASESKRGYEVIVEQFLEGGVECSVETLSYHNKHQVIQITEKISSGPPHCVELGHIQPARISAADRVLVESVIPRMLLALGYTNGPSHTEVKLAGGKLYLIECNTRPGGDFITYPLVNLSTGYFHLQGAIKIALDEFSFPALTEFQTCSAGVLFITQQTSRFEPLFKICQNLKWCYHKNDIGIISELKHNNCDNTNFIMWQSKDGMPQELARLLKQGDKVK